MSQNNHFELHTQNWKMEPILSLADHFHILPVNQDQQKRLGGYYMDDGNDLVRFNVLVRSDTIHRIEMHLALDGGTNLNVFTSSFYLAVHHLDNAIDHFKLYPFQNPSVIPTNELLESAIVPRIFKETIANNWGEIDNHLIDDLFIAKNGPAIERVHYFLIGTAMTNFIKELLKDQPSGYEILGVKIYAGVDLNKFSDKTTISFTPVLGIELPESAIETFMANGNSNCLKGEVLIEYSMPCPTTCYPITPNV